MNETKTVTSKEQVSIELELKSEGKWPVLNVSDSISSLGYQKAEFLEQGLEFGAIFPQDEYEKLNSQLNEKNEQQEHPFNFKSKIYSKKGKLLDISGTASKKGSNVYKFIITITKQKEQTGDSLKAYKMASMIARFFIFEYHIASQKLFVDWNKTDLAGDDINPKMHELPNWLDLILEKDRARLMAAIEQSAKAQCDIANLELEMHSPLGFQMQATFSAKLVKDDDGLPNKYIGVLSDISKHKQELKKEEKITKMLHTLVDIIRQKNLSRDEMLKYAMEKAIELTESQIGYIYLFNEKTNKFTLINWSREVMAQCKVTDPQTEYELEKTGIWGEVVRQRRSMILNDFTKPNDYVKGTPQGHVTLKRWCAIPVIFEGKIVATLGVANSGTDYKQEDVEILTQLMDGVWDYIVDKSLSEQVKDKEQTLDSYVNLAPMIILGLDKEGFVININKPGAEILGGKQEEIVGKNWFDNFLSDSLAVKMRSVFQELSKGGEIEKQAFTHEVLTLQKQSKIILWKNVLIKDVNGGFKMMLSTGQDITERDLLMQELERNKGKFEQYIKEAPIGIYIVNKLGQYKETNKAGCEFFGYSLEEMTHKSIGEMVADKDRDRALKDFKRLVSEGKIKEQYSLKTKDGTLKEAALNAVKIDEDSMLGFVIDISHQFKVSEELKKQNQELAQMNNLMIERELKMRELKAEIAALKAGKVI